MSELRIAIPPSWQDASSLCDWARCDASGAVLEQGSAPLLGLPKGGACVAILPAQRITCVSVAAPSQARRRWEAALPFVAEEYTLTEPEQNHVVPGPGANPGQRTLYIVDKRWLKTFVDACRAAQLNLRRVVPEMLLPPLPGQGWVAVWNGTRGFLRTGPWSGIVLDEWPAEQPPLALQLSLEAAGDMLPQQVEVRFSATATAALPDWGDKVPPLHLGREWDWRREPLLPDLPNLLWGELAPAPRLAEYLPTLRPLLAILLVVLAMEILGSHLRWLQLAQERVALTRDMERTFRQTFGESVTVVDPVLQMQRQLALLRHAAGLADDSDFLPLLDRAAAVLATLPTQSVRALHYDAGRLDIDLYLVRKQLDDVLRRLRDKGLEVQAGAPQDSGGRLAVRLSLRAGEGR